MCPMLVRRALFAQKPPDICESITRVVSDSWTSLLLHTNFLRSPANTTLLLHAVRWLFRYGTLPRIDSTVIVRMVRRQKAFTNEVHDVLKHNMAAKRGLRNYTLRINSLSDLVCIQFRTVCITLTLVQSRFAETLTLTLTLNPNLGESGFGESGRHRS